MEKATVKALQDFVFGKEDVKAGDSMECRPADASFLIRRGFCCAAEKPAKKKPAAKKAAEKGK